MARFQFFSSNRLTDRQNRLLNPASRMRARGKKWILSTIGGVDNRVVVCGNRKHWLNRINCSCSFSTVDYNSSTYSHAGLYTMSCMHACRTSHVARWLAVSHNCYMIHRH